MKEFGKVCNSIVKQTEDFLEDTKGFKRTQNNVGTSVENDITFNYEKFYVEVPWAKHYPLKNIVHLANFNARERGCFDILRDLYIADPKYLTEIDNVKKRSGLTSRADRRILEEIWEKHFIKNERIYNSFIHKIREDAVIAMLSSENKTGKKGRVKRYNPYANFTDKQKEHFAKNPHLLMPQVLRKNRK